MSKKKLIAAYRHIIEKRIVKIKDSLWDGVVLKLWNLVNRPILVAILSIWVLSRIYADYNMIDVLNKISFRLPYAYEYNYRGATNSVGNRGREVLENVPVEINIDEPKRFWFSVANNNYRSLEDVMLTLTFPKEVNVQDWEKQGWIEYQPNEQYSYQFKANIHNGMAQNTNGILLNFSTKGDFMVSYYISGKDIQRKDKKFVIRVK